MKMVEKENDIAAAVPSNAENNGHVEAVDPSAAKNAKEVSNNTEKHSAEDLMGLARLFLKEYYTKLSDSPSEVAIFYGDDSQFVHADVEETGRENIQRAIGGMGFEDCKARFYSLKTVSLPMQGDNAKLIQVCGELTLVKSTVQKQQPVLPRRFVQTIILAHQTPTVLYVKSNVFQWLDTAFLVTVSEKYNAANNAGATVPSPPTTVVESNGANNGSAAMPSPPTAVVENNVANNTGTTVPSPSTTLVENNLANNASATVPSPPITVVESNAVNSVSTNVPSQPTAVLENNVPSNTGTTLASPTTDVVENKVVNNNVTSLPNPPTTVVESQPPLENNITNNKVLAGSYAAIAASAKRNGSNDAEHVKHTVAATLNGPTAPAPTKEAPPNNSNTKPNSEHQITVKQQHPPPPLPPNIAPRREWTHRIYFSQLTKPGRFVDFKLGQQELMREIQAITDGVEFVGIKPNSLRREYRTAFGFIDFTTASDMQAVYDACKRDPNNGSFVLNVRIPEFDFNGGLLLSADKTNNLGGGVYK